MRMYGYKCTIPSILDGGSNKDIPNTNALYHPLCPLYVYSVSYRIILYRVSQKVPPAPETFFAIFSLLVNLCN